ncbi:MAG: biotin/lipoyl-containing protein [Vicinamibacteria bacterium]
MRLEASVEGRRIRVEVRRNEDGYAVILDGRTLDVDLVETGGHFVSLIVDGHSHEVGLEALPGGYRVHLREDTVSVLLADAARDGVARPARSAGPTRVIAPMPGRVVRVLAEKGCEVEPGQGLVVIEAMKMENELKSPRKGCVHEVAVREGQTVEAGALLLVVA